MSLILKVTYCESDNFIQCLCISFGILYSSISFGFIPSLLASLIFIFSLYLHEHHGSKLSPNSGLLQNWSLMTRHHNIRTWSQHLRLSQIASQTKGCRLGVVHSHYIYYHLSFTYFSLHINLLVLLFLTI